MCEITYNHFELKKAIENGKLYPTDVLDVTVWADQGKLDIKLNNNLDEDQIPDELLLFYWNYAESKAYVIREAEIKENSFSLEANRNLLFQMQYLKQDSLRIGLAFRAKQKLFCGYFRNQEVKVKDLTLAERSICKLTSINENALSAYWTEGGILSVMLRNEKKFDEEFYRVKLCGYQWEGGKLITYLETPLTTGKMKVNIYSLSQNVLCQNMVVETEAAGYTGIQAIWKVTVDLSGLSAEDSDGYRMFCEVNGHSFRVFWDCEPNEDALQKFVLQSGKELNACVIQDKRKEFVLKTGKIYPVMLSIVTAVYNTAPFLSEMINSVLQQKVEKLEAYLQDYQKDYYLNIFEFILVDDGSTDGSGDILDDYANISDKIKVIHKENGGVSSARNTGIALATGKYINFADSDDMLSNNFIEECLLFFEEHSDKVDIVTTPMKFFDAATGDHWTNYKFKGNENRVIDLNDEPNAISVFCCSSLYKKTAVTVDSFDCNLINGEDIVFNYDILLNGNRKIAAVGACRYHYRRRSTGEASAIEMSANDPRTYTDYLVNVLERLLLKAIDKDGKIPKYIQYNVMGQLQWKFNTNDKGETGKKILGNEKYREYKEKAISLLRYIDDDVITAQKKIWNEHIYYMLQKKYGHPVLVKEGDNIYFEFNNIRIGTSFGNCYVRITLLNIKNGLMHIEGFSMNYMPEAELLIYVNGKSIVYKNQQRDANKYVFDEICFYATTYSADILLEESTDQYEIEFHGKIDNTEIVKRDLRYWKFMPLTQSYNKSFYSKDGWVVQKSRNKLIAYNMSAPMFVSKNFEEEFEQEVINRANSNVIKNMMILRKQALFRLTEKNKKKIWLISDRVNVAGDNGEAMFRFLAENPDPEIEPYFVIGAEYPDFIRMQQYGKVVPYKSREHLVLHLSADYIVSSAADEFVINPWCDSNAEADLVRDLLARPQFIFLQHGVIQNNLSEWLHKYNKNITGFVCAAPREAKSIIEYNYYYQPEEVWLTGLPRHDRLYHDEKNYITIMPTWRHYLAAKSGKNNELIADFTKSDYFRFYNALINDDRLLSAADKLGYKICFMPHPGIKRKGLAFFNQDPRVYFFDFDITYSKVYAESKLVMTDYSSSVMDFALLHKPVVYCQFDKEYFFENHLFPKGYFDYEKDGFGEVTYSMDALIEVMISYMEDDCRVHEPYGTRMSEFFGFHDQNNCKRVYERIKALS